MRAWEKSGDRKLAKRAFIAWALIGFTAGCGGSGGGTTNVPNEADASGGNLPPPAGSANTNPGSTDQNPGNGDKPGPQPVVGVTCDLTMVADLGTCNQRFGTDLISDPEMLTIFEETCQQLGGKYALAGTCPAQELLGICVQGEGTVYEWASYFYPSSILSDPEGDVPGEDDEAGFNLMTPISMDDARSTCESDEVGVWHNSGSFTPTPADKQTGLEDEGDEEPTEPDPID